MDTDVFTRTLGSPFESPEIRKMVESLGIAKAPRAKKDDPDAYLEAKRLGVQLMFVDDDYLKRKAVQRYGNAPMIYVGATLYSGRQEEDPAYRRYDGPLPGGVSFDDNVDRIIDKLGQPTEIYEDEGTVFTRSWKEGARWLVFSYNAAGVLEYIQISWVVYMDVVSAD